MILKCLRLFLAHILFLTSRAKKKHCADLVFKQSVLKFSPLLIRELFLENVVTQMIYR